MINVRLKDGSEKKYPINTTVSEIAQDISAGLARVALSGEMDGKVVDLRTPIDKDVDLNILTFDQEGGKLAFWHTTTHIMAQAVKRLFPKAKLAIGPAIDTGFYYDFDVDTPFTPEDLEAIEKEMKKIIKENHTIEHFVLPREEALLLMEKQNDHYKMELINDLPENEKISFYKQGEFTDLCAGPHISSTGKIKAFKLLSIAGAYWKGSEKNKMLQRIYGVSYPKKSQLDEHLHRLEEAKKRDHRKLGKELDIFSIQEEGPGFPFFHPNGMVIRNKLEEFWREEHEKRGYQEIKTPIILNQKLWQRSGHWDHYQENMYFTEIDGGNYAIKPMNCPGGMLVYKTKMHSYRDLPLRIGELGLVHRHEMSGALHGLMRVRNFTQDDAHIFMIPEQIKDEIIGVIDLTDYVYNIFGFKYYIELSTRPKNSMGSDEDWDRAINALKEALEEKNIEYRINDGDGAFYGPKIDFHLEDSIGRTWQCGTIQLDFQMPEKFDLTYVGIDGEKHRPAMIHRVIFGSIERFIGILIEHFAGAFPLWISPLQVKIIPIAEKHHDYAEKICAQYKENGIRVKVDYRNEKIGYKIREAQMQKTPYMLVVGDQEIKNNEVALRSRTEGDLGSIGIDVLLKKLLKEIDEKSY